jgi:L,D-transpeptidase catalytic domain
MHPLPCVRASQVFISSPVNLNKPASRNDMYDSLHLGDFGLSKAAFEEGLAGLSLLVSTGDIRNAGILSIVDLSLPSSKKRLFVLDLITGKLIFNTYVSHGRNSGREMATQFSNRPRSCESSLGFYVTGDAYFGHHGYSLKLNGKEEGINDNACSRGIVIHSASYVNERIAEKLGYIGRSEGCPAIPKTQHRNIIEKIKNGTCLFLYSPDRFYETHSKMRLPSTG